MSEPLNRWDYIAPGFEQIDADVYFPNLTSADPMGLTWPYLRKEVPHKFYVDRRFPDVGFVNRDEAHILFNTALRFSGKRALEIGCFLGWSACHLALAGVELDVIDPLLSDPRIQNSVFFSLKAAGVLERVNLFPARSPEAVLELARSRNASWPLIFIDGDHESPAPLKDAEVCESLAPADALVLFHDLAAPAVAEGLRYFRSKGWQTRIYHTMQIMGAAWRGNARPIDHQPDPAIDWRLPEHLLDFT